jgi:L-iditol 2-dehydrogenase
MQMHCRQCLTGNAFACSSKRAPGYFSNGAFTEYISVPAWLLHRIPSNLSFVEAALTEPSAVAAHGMLDRTGIFPEDVVLILGCGPIGLIAAKMAQAAGASKVIITGVEHDEKMRLPKARELGIDYAVNVMKEDLAALVNDLTHGEGADVVIELSGALPAINQSFQLARRLGRVGIIGQPPTDEIKIPYRQAMFRALTVSFSYVLPLEDWSRGFDLSHSGEAVKVVLEPLN